MSISPERTPKPLSKLVQPAGSLTTGHSLQPARPLDFSTSLPLGLIVASAMRGRRRPVVKMRTMINKIDVRAGQVAAFLICLTTPGLRAEETGQERLDWAYPLAYSSSGLAVGFGLLYATGSFDSGPSVHNFERAFTSAPVWDEDPWVVNFVLHPLWGSETYLRAREAGFGVPGSIAFSLGMSVTWEYLFESWGDQPSIQDLIFTTGLGWPIGELRYRLKQNSSPRAAWFIDPIEKTLEHFKIIGGVDHGGRTSTFCALSWSF